MGYREVILADRPLGYWPLCDAGAVARDVSGHGHDGTLNAPYQNQKSPLIPDESGKSIGLTGGFVSLGTGAPWSPQVGASGQISVEALFVSTLQGTGTQMWIASKGWNSGPQYEWSLGVTDVNNTGNVGAVIGAIYTLGGSNVMFLSTAQNVVNALGLYHVVWTYNRALPMMAIYLNGMEIATDTTATGTSSAGGATTMIGERQSDGEPWNGSLGHVSIWDYALSAAQVRNHYLASKGMAMGQGIWTPNRARLALR